MIMHDLLLGETALECIADDEGFDAWDRLPTFPGL